MVFVFPCILGSFQSDSSVSYIYCFLDTFWKTPFRKLLHNFIQCSQPLRCMDSYASSKEHKSFLSHYKSCSYFLYKTTTD